MCCGRGRDLFESIAPWGGLGVNPNGIEAEVGGMVEKLIVLIPTSVDPGHCKSSAQFIPEFRPVVSLVL